MNLNGLVLSGGGARTAFQVGVLKAIKEWVQNDQSPFKVVSGVSAGSINAAYLAANADQFCYAVDQLESMWRTLTTKYVYNSPLISSSQSMTVFKVFQNVIKGKGSVNSILNAMPLARLLSNRIDFGRIQQCLDNQSLHSLAITATSFHESMATTFVQSNHASEWNRVRREGISSIIKTKHLMASTAIPFLFSPVRIKQQFYGDGSLRNIAPYSPAIRCGAQNLVVIGVREANSENGTNRKSTISFGDIFSKILNTILFDSLDVDHERMTRINQTIEDSTNGHSKLKVVDSVMIRPSVNVNRLVNQYSYESPEILEQLLKLLGSKNNGNELRSYLMFEAGYLSALIDLGYQDAQHYKDQVIELINK